MTRVGRFIGVVLVWTVLAVAAAALFVVGLPLLAVAALLRGIYELGCAAVRRFKAAGPDDLDDVLRARIDGAGEAYAADLLSCGCPQTMPVTARCSSCGWKSCLAHAGAAHLCERDPTRSWQAAPLPAHEVRQVDRAFADLVSGLADLNHVDTQLSRYYLIGDEK
jgi:hypothetical protein